MRERIGIVLGTRRRVPAAALHGVVVSRLGVVDAVSVANLRSARAVNFGVLNELASMVPYDVPQAWARALDAAGLRRRALPGPVLDRPGRFARDVRTCGDRPSWPVDPTPIAAADVPGAPVLRDPPRLDELTVVPTPRGRPKPAG